jgi:hypothetical protein
MMLFELLALTRLEKAMIIGVCFWVYCAYACNRKRNKRKI